MILKTRRLVLREITLRDAREFSTYNFQERFYKYLPISPPSVESTKSYVQGLIAQKKILPRFDYHFVIMPRSSKRVLGDICLRVDPLAPHKAIIGFGLNPLYWGHGYASEALKVLIRFGFTSLKLQRIYGICDPCNTASKKIMGKCGLKYEGRIRCDEYIRGKFKDNLYYSILKRESGKKPS